jgi:phosphatidylinositol alpha-mannosyltransferase
VTPAVDAAGLRVGLVCPYSWSHKGGVNAHVAGFAAALRAQDVEVEVLAPGEPPLDDAVWLGRTVAIPNNGSVGHVALSPAASWRTAGAVRSRRYDLLHVHEPVTPVVGWASLAAARVPVVGTFHRYSKGPGFYRGPMLPVCRWVMSRLAAAITVSDAAREYIARAVPGEYHVVPNGIDVAALRPPAGSRTGRRILFVGRPEPRKGLPVLLAAMRRLPGDVQLDLVGAHAEDLEHLPGGPYELERVRAHGRVDDATRLRLMGETDVLCAPSLMGESFGIVLVEGMAAGLPVVASRITGYADVLPDDCGYLVAPGDPDVLAAALAELLAEPSLRAAMGETGLRAAGRYDWSNVTREVLDIYAQALGLPSVGRAGEPSAGPAPAAPEQRRALAP